MEQTVIQIGNSVGVIIPSSLKGQAGIKKGSKVYVDVDSLGNVVISKNKASAAKSDFLKALEGVNKRYGTALRELAGKQE